MPPTNDSLLLLLAVLVAISVGGRSYIAWQALARRAAGIRRRAATLDERSAQLSESFPRFRTRLAEVDGSVERSRDALVRFDAWADAQTRDLVAMRVTLREIRARHLVTARTLLSRARSSARLVMMALKLRRSLGA